MIINSFNKLFFFFISLLLFKKGNNLTERAVNSFILALQYQKVILEMNKAHGLGLMRLILQVI